MALPRVGWRLSAKAMDPSHAPSPASAPHGALAIFVKTPGLSSVKTRLAAGIGAELAAEFYRLAVEAVRALARNAGSELGLIPYWAVAEEAGLNHPAWSDLDRIWQGEGGLGTRLHTVYQQLLEKHAAVLLIGADSPQLDGGLLRSAVTELHRDGSVGGAAPFVLGRTDDGGYYLFGGRQPVSREIFETVPYSVATTADAFARHLRPLGAIHELPRLCDVDTVADLIELGQYHSTRPVLLPEQIRVIEWAKKVAFSLREK